MKKSHKRSIFLCILILLSNFYQITEYSLGADFQIAAEKDDVITYKITFGEDINYTKFIINQTVENSSSIIICYNAYFAEKTLDFNESEVEYINRTLTGNVSEDLFGSKTILNMIMPIGINFSASENELQSRFDGIEDLEVNISTSTWGFSINIAFYIRLVFLIKVMELNYFYSTTGILLLGYVYFNDPNSDNEASGKFEIIPKLSTISGADENPYNPGGFVGGENSTDPTDKKNIQLDSQGIITITLGCVGIGGIISGIVYLVKKKKPKNSSIEL